MVPNIMKVPLAILSLPISAVLGLILLAIQRKEFRLKREGVLSLAIVVVIAACVVQLFGVAAQAKPVPETPVSASTATR
jgi:hypothetical protein